ncbi:ECF-type sigma factor [soil metagenome]
MNEPAEDLTDLIHLAAAGDRRARDAVFEWLYRDLKTIAHARLLSGGRNTYLDTTALVHESCLRLFQKTGLSLENRRHFLAYAARAMRSVIVDFVRSRNAERRGGHLERVVLDTAALDAVPNDEQQILDVHEALLSLAEVDERLVCMVEMRYFAGLDESEIADALGIHTRTVHRDWKRARLLLMAALR